MKKCKLCDSLNVKLYYEGLLGDEKYEYFLCKNCETIFLQTPLSEKFLEEYYSNQNYHSTEHHSSDYFANRENSYKNKMKRILCHVDPKAHLLDYGCGDGSFIQYLYKNGFSNAYGFEYEQGVRSELKEKGIKIYDPESTETFDIITLFDVIEHVKDPVSLFETLANKLKQNGTLIITTGVYSDYFNLIDKGYCSWINYPQHLWVYSKKSMELINNNHLKLISFGVNGVHFASNIRVIGGQIKNILLHYLKGGRKKITQEGFPGFNGVYIFKK